MFILLLFIEILQAHLKVGFTCCTSNVKQKYTHWNTILRTAVQFKIKLTPFYDRWFSFLLSLNFKWMFLIMSKDTSGKIKEVFFFFF